MLRHKILCTDVQRIKIQEISLSPSPLNPTPSIRDSSSSLPPQQQWSNNNPPTRNNASTHHNHNNTHKRNNTNHEPNLTGNEAISSADCRAPRTFEFEIRGALVNRCCIAGDIVNVIGVVKTATAVSNHVHILLLVGSYMIYYFLY